MITVTGSNHGQFREANVVADTEPNPSEICADNHSEGLAQGIILTLTSVKPVHSRSTSKRFAFLGEFSSAIRPTAIEEMWHLEGDLAGNVDVEEMDLPMNSHKFT